jgi:hypothetical protein
VGIVKQANWDWRKRETDEDEQQQGGSGGTSSALNGGGSFNSGATELASASGWGEGGEERGETAGLLNGGGFASSAAAEAAGGLNGGSRRVAFETTVTFDSGDTLPLRTESDNSRSNFVRGVGPIDKSSRGDGMDSLRQFQAPLGYRLLERLTPRGRGFSLQVPWGRACLVAPYPAAASSTLTVV